VNLIPPTLAAYERNHPHAHVEVLDKSGHTIFADEPENFFGILRNFLLTKKVAVS
jgi:pimeloyl-ACP methyl ester carboxylesterase